MENRLAAKHCSAFSEKLFATCVNVAASGAVSTGLSRDVDGAAETGGELNSDAPLDEQSDVSNASSGGVNGAGSTSSGSAVGARVKAVVELVDERKAQRLLVRGSSGRSSTSSVDGSKHDALSSKDDSKSVQLSTPKRSSDTSSVNSGSSVTKKTNENGSGTASQSNVNVNGTDDDKKSNDNNNNSSNNNNSNKDDVSKDDVNRVDGADKRRARRTRANTDNEVRTQRIAELLAATLVDVELLVAWCGNIILDELKESSPDTFLRSVFVHMTVPLMARMRPGEPPQPVIALWRELALAHTRNLSIVVRFLLRRSLLSKDALVASKTLLLMLYRARPTAVAREVTHVLSLKHIRSTHASSTTTSRAFTPQPSASLVSSSVQSSPTAKSVDVDDDKTESPSRKSVKFSVF